MYAKIRCSDGWVVYPPGFRYVHYWSTWHRVLGIYTAKNGLQSSVELELTPINPSWVRSWADMGERIILCQPQYYRMGDKDKYADTCPPEVYTNMVARLGETKANRLMLFDYFPQIDFGKYECIKNGGAQFRDCCKLDGDE